MSETPYMLIYVLSDYVHELVPRDQKPPDDILDHIAKETEKVLFRSTINHERESVERVLHEENIRIKKELSENLEPVSEYSYNWISAEWLKNWLTGNANFNEKIDNTVILCKHKNVTIDTTKIKRISNDSWKYFIGTYNGGPALTQKDNCLTCVIEHIEGATKLDKLKKIVTDIDFTSYHGFLSSAETRYMSKVWFEDLKKAIKDNNTELINQLEPDFTNGIYCRHHNLISDVTAYKKISDQCFDELVNEFPVTKSQQAALEPCSICAQQQKQEKTERLHRSNIKRDLNTFYQAINRRNTGTPFRHGKHYVIHISWAKIWKEYIDDASKPKPNRIDNSPLICSHNKFISIHDLDESHREYVLVEDYEWKKLCNDFEPVHPIHLRIITASSISYIESSDPPICLECTNLKSKEKEMENQYFQDTKLHIEMSPKIVYLEKGETYISTSYNLTVGELKLRIYQALDVDLSEQQLYFNQTFLEDDTKTLLEYKVTPLKSIIVKRKAAHHSYYSRSKETGFEGSILTHNSSQSPTTISPKQIESPLKGWICTTCTFHNPNEEIKCKICSYVRY